MGRQPRLLRRGTRWYLRVKVPADLVTMIGRREIRQTLRASEYRVAVERVRQASADVDRVFAEARSKVSLQRGAKSRRATDADIRRLVRTWLTQMEQRAVRADTDILAAGQFDHHDAFG